MALNMTPTGMSSERLLCCTGDGGREGDNNHDNERTRRREVEEEETEQHTDLEIEFIRFDDNRRATFTLVC